MNRNHSHYGFDQHGCVGPLVTWRRRHGRRTSNIHVHSPDRGMFTPWVKIALSVSGDWVARVYDPSLGKSGRFREVGRGRTALAAYRVVRGAVMDELANIASQSAAACPGRIRESPTRPAAPA